MIKIRRGNERGGADHGWLDTRHTFSFATYHDPRWMGFRSLRVLNEDRVAAGMGFGPHPHRDMEIVTYVLEGALEHKDNMGNGSILRAGDVQRMTAGTGVVHSEANPSPDAPVHFLQIWLLPSKPALAPSYEDRTVPLESKRAQWRLIASPDAREGILKLHQDAELFATCLEPGERIAHTFRMGRAGWLQVARGSLVVNGHLLHAGDGAAIVDEGRIEATAESDTEALLFDLA